MTSSRSSITNNNELELEPGKAVRTPMGAIVIVRRVIATEGHVEVTVEYPSGEKATFQARHLKPLP